MGLILELETWRVCQEAKPEHRAYCLALDWPEPFNVLFPTGGSLDLYAHWVWMQECVKRYGSGQRGEARKLAQTWVDRLTGEGESSYMSAIFLPKALANPQEAMFFLEGSYDQAGKTLPELLDSEEFRLLAQEPVRVRRVVSWPGYFWWVLLGDLTANISVRCCKHCGKIIRGGHFDRQYCKREENIECFRQRDADRQRKSQRK